MSFTHGPVTACGPEGGGGPVGVTMLGAGIGPGVTGVAVPPWEGIPKTFAAPIGGGVGGGNGYSGGGGPPAPGTPLGIPPGNPGSIIGGLLADPAPDEL